MLSNGRRITWLCERELNVNAHVSWACERPQDVNVNVNVSVNWWQALPKTGVDIWAVVSRLINNKAA